MRLIATAIALLFAAVLVAAPAHADPSHSGSSITSFSNGLAATTTDLGW